MKKLKELALKTITEHIDRFNLAFQHSSDQGLQMNMVLLRREFGFYLISELIKRDKLLEEKYFLFLLNEYSQVLDLTLWEHCDLNFLAERFTVMGEHLVEVQIEFRNSPRSSVLPDHLASSNDQGSKLQHFINSIISKIIKVKVLKIPQLCNDDTLKLIGSHCNDLTELDIRESEDISFAGFKSLFKKKKSALEIKVPIKKLNMESTIVDDKVIYYLLKHLTCLEIFIYPDIGELLYLLYRKDIFNNTLSNAKKCNLTFLDLTQYCETSLTDILNVCTVVCPFIKKLSMPALNEEQVELISKFPALNSLTLKGEPGVTSRLDVSNYLILIKNKLLELKIDYFSISVISLIQNCPNLQLLYLYNVNFVNVDCQCDLSLSNLYHLTLHSIFIRNHNFMNALAFMKLLSSSPNLKKLTINFCQDILNVYEEYLVNFFSKCIIERLEFNYNSLEISVLERMIKNCSSLKTIVFKMSFMARGTIQQLSRFPNVIQNNITLIY